jgi:hypothetical protein
VRETMSSSESELIELLNTSPALVYKSISWRCTHGHGIPSGPVPNAYFLSFRELHRVLITTSTEGYSRSYSVLNNCYIKKVNIKKGWEQRFLRKWKAAGTSLEKKVGGPILSCVDENLFYLLIWSLLSSIFGLYVCSHSAWRVWGNDNTTQM